MELKERNFKKIGLICVAVLLCGMVFSYGIFPSILRFMIKQNVLLKPGTQIRDMFEKIPFPLDFKLHIFNVTNPDEIMRGGKPRVNDIGPLYFEEWKEKYDTVDNVEEDTLTFTLRNTWIFRPDLSALTGEEIVTIPHPLIMGVLLMVQRDREAMMPLVKKGVNILFDPLESAFLKVRIMDLLFDGIYVDCSSQDFAAKALCSGMDSEGAVMPHNETHYKFSFFGMRNHTEAGRWVVYRGVKNIRDLGRVVSYNEETEMDIWDGDECNQYIGTDSTIFPPFLTAQDRLWAWSPEICRSLGAHYVHKSKYAGLPMSYFELDFGDLKNEPHNHCFCRDAPDDCPPKGTMDLSPCLGGPIIGSKPHFYGADPKLVEAVDGLAPNKAAHDVYIHFELASICWFTGSPVSAAKRLQFSMELGPIRDHELFGQLPDVILPMFWAEEGASLNKTWTNQLKYQLFLGLKFNATVKWLTIIIGTVGAVGSAYMYFRKETKTTDVAPVDVSTPDTNPSSAKDGVVNVSLGRNLPPVIDGLDKPPKLRATELQQERY
ncbi:AGAP002451-PA [Anopheles gambiae str. PEST]|uniref:Sensory neuron membrane protein 1 n=2 Tax=gambiae species complex TaxID=44542 RepID=SNMP1_ANOGA|nr:RecName: Full=Sensory neuron membrane protein 1; AltName: Full=Scavenger receptor class B [Anopheles gambiae]EAA07986.4 AGAP002451-PA [Anopheles gambiae str. PEST]